MTLHSVLIKLHSAETERNRSTCCICPCVTWRHSAYWMTHLITVYRLETVSHLRFLAIRRPCSWQVPCPSHRLLLSVCEYRVILPPVRLPYSAKCSPVIVSCTPFYQSSNIKCSPESVGTYYIKSVRKKISPSGQPVLFQPLSVVILRQESRVVVNRSPWLKLRSSIWWVMFGFLSSTSNVCVCKLGVERVERLSLNSAFVDSSSCVNVYVCMCTEEEPLVRS